MSNARLWYFDLQDATKDIVSSQSSQKKNIWKIRQKRLNFIMALRLLLILAVVGQWKLTHLVTVSGFIGKFYNNVTFIHKKFPVPLSKRAIIEYDVRFVSKLPTGLTMGIYTTQDHVNIQKRCTETRYGQLGNKHLHLALNTGLPACKLMVANVLHCRDRITVQDFMPRTFSFSFGFECDLIKFGPGMIDVDRLYDILDYDVSIIGQTNRTSCASNWGNPDTEMCDFESVITTNLLGNKLSHSKDTAYILKAFYNRAGKTLDTNPICYQHFIETACHILLPPCQPDTGLVIHPCKEACYDMIKMCKHDLNAYEIFGDFWEFDCDYLPSVLDETPCFYKPVTCYEPPHAKHADTLPQRRPIPVKHANKQKQRTPPMVFTSNYYQSQLHNLDDVVTYFCHSGYKLIGNNNIICMNSREWSALPPQCLPEFTTEPITELTTESPTESSTEFTPEYTIEPINESTAETKTKSTTESTTEFITNFTARSTTESTAKFTTQLKYESITEHKVVFKGTVFAEPAAKSMSKSIGTTKTNLLNVVAPLLFILLIVANRYKIKLKAGRKHGFQREQVRPDHILNDLKLTGEPLLPLDRKQDSALSLVSVATLKQNRNRIFDAFVLYHFDSDDDFVVNSLLPELEEERDFKLCIHSRDFTPGRDIKDNIEEAIEGSNSAIIVMSQGFVDSMWCKEEFTHCYIENMKDPEFNLFVIMMQPADTLINISNYMKTFFETKTYLHINDPKLFSKLATHLEDAKKMENATLLFGDNRVEAETQF